MNTNRIDKEILHINESVCRHINNLERDGRAYVAQDVVTDLRHLVDHVSLKIYASSQHIDVKQLFIYMGFPDNWKIIKDCNKRVR